jgi:hypothetical protein
MNLNLLNCPKKIQFFEKKIQKKQISPSKIMAYILQNKQDWIHKNVLPKYYNNFMTIPTVCNAIDFNIDSYKYERHPNAHKKIPLKKRSKVGNCRQYVFGRVQQLVPYYVDKENFITLTLPEEIWSDNYKYTMENNDLFVYCAITSEDFCDEKYRKEFFPIRLVLHPNDAILLKKDLLNIATQRQSIRSFYQNWRISSVLARELCQLINLFDIYIYQSTSYNNIFFIKLENVENTSGLKLIYP